MGRGTLYLMVANGFFVLAGYLIHFGLGRYLGPAGYGVFGVVLAMMTNVSTILTAGFPQGAARYIAEDSSRTAGVVRAANRIQLVSGLLITGLYFSLAGVIAELLNNPSLAPYIRLSALAVPAYAFFSVYNAGYLNGLRDFGRQALSSLASSAAKIILVLVFLLLGLGVMGAILGYILAAAVGLLLSWRLVNLSAAPQSDFRWQRLAGFGLPATTFALAFLLLLSIDLLAVQALGASETEVGYYAAAGTISRVSYFVFLGLAATLLPSISRSTARLDVELTRSYIRQAMRYMLMLLAPAVLLISATAGDLLALVYSSGYAGAAGPLGVLVFGLALLSIFFVLANVIMGAGQPRVVLGMTLPLVAIDIGLNVLLIPPYGLTGAAWATTISGFLGMSAATVYVLRRFGTLVNPKSLARIGLAAAVVYALATRVPYSPWLPLIYASLFLGYAGLLWLIREITREDLVIIGRMLPLDNLRRVGRTGRILKEFSELRRSR
ncbi:MAG: flippase [Chloroflexi bacterium]|nr:flippase [Chloroflexota bacterium]